VAQREVGMTRIRNWFLAVAFLAGLVCVAGSAAAQEASPEAAGEAPAAEPKEPIASSELGRKAEETMDSLRRIGQESLRDPYANDISDAFQEGLVTSDSLRASIGIEKLGTLDRADLETKQRRGKRYRTELKNWQGWLEKRAGHFDDLRDEISEIRESWATTAALAGGEELPAVSIDRIQSVLTETRKVEAEVLTGRSAVLEFQDKITGELVWLNEALDVMAATLEERKLGKGLDSEPLWDDVAATGTKSVAEQATETLGAAFRALVEFIELDGKKITYHALAALLLLGWLYWIRRHHAMPEDKSVVDVTARILGRPIPAAGLVALIATYWVYPNPPEQVLVINSMALILPMVFLIPSIIPQSMHRPFYGLMIAYLLNGFGEIAADGTLLDRLLLFALSIFGIAGLARLLRPSSPMLNLGAGNWFRFLIVFAWASLVGLIVSLVSNLVGNVTLAQLLFRGILLAAYFGMILYAGCLVIKAIGSGFAESRAARGFRSLRSHGDVVRRRSSGVLYLVALFIWFRGAADLFSVRTTLERGALSVLDHSISIGAAELSLGGVISFSLVLWASVWVSRFIRFLLQVEILPRLHLPRGVPQTITTIGNYIILLLGFILALVAAGVELTKLTLVVSAFGVGIGFGLQNIVNNFVSGLILAFERPIQVGDTIQVTALVGTVRHIGVRSSTVRTFDGADVIVPNGDLISKEVVNWTLSDQLRRMEVKVGVAYGTDPHRVMEVLLAATEHKDVLKSPAPFTLFKGFGDSSLDFVVRFWTRNYQDWILTQSDVTVAVNDGLAGAGIEIPFPQRDLHVRSAKGLEDTLGRARKEDDEGVSQETESATPESPAPESPSTRPSGSRGPTGPGLDAGGGGDGGDGY